VSAREWRDLRWIVVTFDGLFLGIGGALHQEYPEATIFDRETLAQAAARKAGNIGPYRVLSTEQYQMDYES
jgi:hypothetical protein